MTGIGRVLTDQVQIEFSNSGELIAYGAIVYLPVDSWEFGFLDLIKNQSVIKLV